MRYCGIALGPGFLQLAALEEVVVAEPPVRLRASFYEPGDAGQVAAELRALGDVVIGIGAPAGENRACDRELAERGIPPLPYSEAAARLYAELSELGVYMPAHPNGHQTGPVEEGAFRGATVFETSPDAVFIALQGRRVPARRHPLGIQRRIEELEQDHVHDPGSDLWSRRIEEIEAAGVALAAHRFAVAHASWVGDPGEAVVVLPGSRVPERFGAEGVLPSVPRASLPPAA
ncbi:MAG TPA: hypothetical protein VGF74_02900 [Thermoleophilaceae bacterium]